MDLTRTFWKKCSNCKKELAFGSPHYVCSVSTCRGKRTGLAFCSVACWDAHLGFANHRSAFAEDAKAPSREEYMRASTEEGEHAAPQNLVVKRDNPSITDNSNVSTAMNNEATAPEVETLVVVSKVKKLIKELSQLNTSQCAIDALTTQVVTVCKNAIESARTAGRKTVMGRDIIPENK